ncbi:VOC family protein [Streptomyces lasalocidi]|uniref:VOC family protein n=1 Tax=Streptomyces lasalocidi TaxID=324833 RepID=UPI00143D176E|nr:VOC family protein [Streptomyces lasalocidi]
MRPSCTLAATTLDAPDAHALARFYRDLLGRPVRKEEPGWLGPPFCLFTRTTAGA